MTKTCDACEFLKDPQNEILVTDNWTVSVYNDQPYLGRAYCNLKTHKSSLGELTKDEWQDLQLVFSQLEKMYEAAFGAELLNVECNMNHAFRSEPYNPHVHWHIYPRYSKPVEVAGVVFDDPLFGNHIDEDLDRVVDDEVVKEIFNTLRSHAEK